MIPQELRIGNYYKSVKFGCTVKCDLSDLYNLCANADGATDHPPIDEMFKPIPLDAEWLIKFGFKSSGDKYKYTYTHGATIVLCNRHVFHIKNYYDNCIKSEIEYVHQLQNLYFALTGEELQIK